MRETFGDRLCRLRTERQLSRYAVAQGTGLSQPLMQQLERLCSGLNVHGRTLRRLARFYGVSMEYILGPDEDDEAHAA